MSMTQSYSQAPLTFLDTELGLEYGADTQVRREGGREGGRGRELGLEYGADTQVRREGGREGGKGVWEPLTRSLEGYTILYLVKISHLFSVCVSGREQVIMTIMRTSLCPVRARPLSQSTHKETITQVPSPLPPGVSLSLTGYRETEGRL